jgi:hypothetical protein
MSKQAINQFAIKPHGPRLNCLQMEPICQVYESIAHTSKYAPRLHTFTVRNLNQRKHRACTWLMCLLSLTLPCLERWLMCTARNRGRSSLVPFPSSSLPLPSVRLQRRHEWKILLHLFQPQFLFTETSKHYYDPIQAIN